MMKLNHRTTEVEFAYAFDMFEQRLHKGIVMCDDKTPVGIELRVLSHHESNDIDMYNVVHGRLFVIDLDHASQSLSKKSRTWTFILKTHLRR